MQEKVYAENTLIRYSECDRAGRVKLASWFDYLQETAANHAAALGIGYDSIRKIGRIWVLNRLKLEILRQPAVCDRITVTTYPNLFRRIFAERQFVISAGDVELAHASSEWLYLDSRTLRPARMTELPIGLPDNSDMPVYFEFGTKITPLPLEEMNGRMELLVRHSMEDVNAHMNNAGYAGLVQDVLSGISGAPVCIRRIELAWHHAVCAGDILTVGGKISGDGTFLVSGYRAGGDVSFAAAGLLG